MWVKYLSKERRKPPAGNKFGGIRKKEKKKRKGAWRREKRIFFFFFFSLFLSQIYGNRTVGFLRTKKQSSSTHRGLHVGTGFEEFR